MEKLIKIQAIINQIEDLQELNAKFRSTFKYINDDQLEIETYCTDAAIGYYKALEGGMAYTVYIQNSKIKILEHLEF